MKIEDICTWLPPIIKLETFSGDWDKYYKNLYEKFVNDFIEKPLYFNNKIVQVRINPKQNNYEHAFIHLTCETMKDGITLNDRIPDLRRCERIGWNRAIINNYPCTNSCKNCDKILYYEEYYKNTIRISLLFYDVRFKVILEQRENYYLLITGYYIKYDFRLNKELKRAKDYFQQKTPLD